MGQIEIHDVGLGIKIPVLFCVSQMGEERTQQESSPQSIIPSIRPTR